MLVAYLVIRLLTTNDPRWCVAIGAVVGVGLMTKYTMIFFVGGLVVGLLLTEARRFLLNRWFWAGVGLAAFIFLPNLIWQIRHDFVSYHFLHYIHLRDVGEGRAEGFWQAQYLSCANRFALPLWITGLIALLWSRRFRPLAAMYLVPVGFFWLAKGRGYYTGAAYPMLMAMGAVLIERWLGRLSRLGRVILQSLYVATLILWGAYVSLSIVPFAASGTLRDLALDGNGDLREEIGWNQLVKQLADIRDSLPAEQRPHVGILVGNYGEQGAVEILGPRYHLPPPISGTNSAWFRGYPVMPPTTLIVVGHSRKFVEENLTACRIAGHNANSEGIHNEESADHPDIFVCSSPRLPWPEFWRKHKYFG